MMSRHKLTVVLVAFALSACGPSSAPMNERSTGPVLAKVDDLAIHAEDIQASLALLPEPARIGILNNTETLRRYVEEYAHKEILYREAVRQGVDKDPEVRRQIAAAEKSIVTQRLLEKTLQDKVKVTEEDMKKYFEEHKDEFTAEDRWTLAHIQFDSLKAAQEAAARLGRGEDFAALARSLSTDVMSKDKGGVLGTVERSKAPPEFVQALTGRKKGEVSAPIKTQHGYHLVKLVDVQPGGLVAFEGVREPLRQYLTEEKYRRALETYLAALKQNHKVELQAAEIDRFSETHRGVKK